MSIRTLGQFDDALPEGGQPRAAMPAPDGNVTIRPQVYQRGWRYGRAEYLDYQISAPALWNKLVTNIQYLFVYDRASDLSRFRYNAFKAAAGDFDSFIDAVGRSPGNDNPPLVGAGPWVQGRRPVLPFTYPRGFGGNGNGISGPGSINWGIGSGLIDVYIDKRTSPGVFDSGPFIFMTSIPIMTDVLFL